MLRPHRILERTVYAALKFETHVQDLRELFVTDIALLSFAKVSLDEVTVKVERHVLVHHRVPHDRLELVCKANGATLDLNSPVRAPHEAGTTNRSFALSTFVIHAVHVRKELPIFL